MAAPYPPHKKGEKYREIPFPVESPDRTSKPMMAKRRDGREVDLMATIGAAPKVAVRSPDELVGDWTAWPP